MTTRRFFRDGLPGVRRQRSSYDAEARREEAPAKLPTEPECPFCDGTETEIMSGFGSHASVSTYWCRACRSPFEVMKWRGEA
jgi:transcription elongation factor Elf1